ncbi:hypothetical protein LJC49_02835 [Ruminococcaceae bacterium OttesenSCG-928-I18]|nr:hypothetical protein [Ruminococcaceae bacterium OttesenSCG-928-I18]
MREKITELMKNKDFFEQLSTTNSAAEVKTLFANHGIDAESDELLDILADIFLNNANEDLSDDDLASVAGGGKDSTQDEKFEAIKSGMTRTARAIVEFW